MRIRPETESDFLRIHDFVKTAFQTAYRSDGTEQDYVNKLRNSGNYIPELALVAEDENDDCSMIGHIMLTRIAIAGNKAMPENTQAILLLAPVAIAVERRNKGLGSILIRESLKRAKDKGYAAVILVGNPHYYERFGFVSAAKFGIQNRQNIPDENVMVLELKPGVLNDISGIVDFY